MAFDIYVMVKETGAVIHASERSCHVREVKREREWTYTFEVKGQAKLVLHVEQRDGSLQLTLNRCDGDFHMDVFALNRVVWRDVGGSEHRHVGESAIVFFPPEIPEVPPTPVPTAPAPPFDVTALINRLDVVVSLLQQLKGDITVFPMKSNNYIVVTLDLSTARSEFETSSVWGQAVTVYRCTGTFDLKLGDKAMDTITITPLVYPAMLVFDKVEFSKFFVRNTAQPGSEATLIVWRRE